MSYEHPELDPTTMTPKGIDNTDQPQAPVEIAIDAQGNFHHRGHTMAEGDSVYGVMRAATIAGSLPNSAAASASPTGVIKKIGRDKPYKITVRWPEGKSNAVPVTDFYWSPDNGHWRID